MYKIILAFIASVLFIGCSNFSINASMCDRVSMDPLATVPAECRRYSEEEAGKSYNKGKEILSTEDAVKYTK